MIPLHMINGPALVRTRLTLAVALSLVLLTGATGCAKSEQSGAAYDRGNSAESAKPTEASSMPMAEAKAAEPNDSAPVPGPRIVIKTGSISVIVEDAAKAMEQVQTMLTEAGGFISNKTASATVPYREVLSSSNVNTIRLELRIPADRFDSFAESVKSIGSFTNEHYSVEDVTFQYVDLEARLANQKKVEERLQKHLLEADKMTDTLEVERELARVREAIETLTAQFKVLADRVAFSTLTLEISVRPGWTPPVERGFFEDIWETLTDSLVSLGQAARVFVVYAIAVIPWIAAIFVLFVGLIFVVRLLRGRRRSR